jgi:hypothetical protein
MRGGEAIRKIAHIKLPDCHGGFTASQWRKTF